MSQPDFSGIGRDEEQCKTIWQVRLKYSMPVLTDENRNKFLVITLAKLHPTSRFGRMINSLLYDDPKAFDELDMLTKFSTLERTNREMEKHGFFTKEKDQPPIVRELQNKLF